MRKLLLLAFSGMALSKLYFGSFLPPDLRLKAPGFNILKDGANAPKPRWFAHPTHLDPAWMHPRQQIDGRATLAHASSASMSCMDPAALHLIFFARSTWR